MSRSLPDTSLLDALDRSAIHDQPARQAIRRLLTRVEELNQEHRALRDEHQRLRDEVSRLKGEPGTPKGTPNTPKPPAPDYSSEGERRQPKPRGKRGKRDAVPIDREQVLTVDPATLPPDAAFKAYVEVVVQDLVVRTDNVRFRKEQCSSPSQGKTDAAELPPGDRGEFGPGIRARALVVAVPVR